MASNEGRDRNLLATLCLHNGDERGLERVKRSTKAGTVIPATLLNLEEWPVWRKSHEWKHGRYRGIAENPINSVCFAVPSVANHRDWAATCHRTTEIRLRKMHH